jgi:hypothetical protein
MGGGDATPVIPASNKKEVYWFKPVKPVNTLKVKYAKGG